MLNMTKEQFQLEGQGLRRAAVHIVKQRAKFVVLVPSKGKYRLIVTSSKGYEICDYVIVRNDAHLS